MHNCNSNRLAVLPDHVGIITSEPESDDAASDSPGTAELRRNIETVAKLRATRARQPDAPFDLGPLELARVAEENANVAATMLYMDEAGYKKQIWWIKTVRVISHDLDCCYPLANNTRGHWDGCSTQSCTTFRNNYPRHTPVDLKHGGAGGCNVEVVQDFVDPQDVRNFHDPRTPHDGRNYYVQDRLLRKHREAFIGLCGEVKSYFQGAQVLFFVPSLGLS
jgi:hypothetical protein